MPLSKRDMNELAKYEETTSYKGYLIIDTISIKLLCGFPLGDEHLTLIDPEGIHIARLGYDRHKKGSALYITELLMNMADQLIYEKSKKENESGGK